MRLQRLITCTALLCTAAAWGAPARQLPRTAAPASAATADAGAAAGVGREVERTLADLGEGTSPIRLETWDATRTLKLPVAPREIIKGASVSLETANSTALIKSRSALSIRANGQVLKQFALDPENTLHRRDIDIPVSLLKSGYNDVQLTAVQHYTYDCEDPASPELWTEINPFRSTMAVDVAGLRANFEPKLSQLHLAFDKRSWLDVPLAVVFGTEGITDAQTTAAALVVQGIALRKGSKAVSPYVFTASTAAAMQPTTGRLPGLSAAVAQGKDVVLVGRRSELTRYMDSQLHGLVGNGAFVGIFEINNGLNIALVVSGNTDEEVLRAARAVADPLFKFSDVAMELVNPPVAFTPPAIATAGKSVSFSEFEYRTTTARGMKAPAVPLYFRAPSDFGAQKGDLAKVALHFSYGAGLRPDSSLVIRLNGHFAVSVPLSAREGQELLKYEVQLPAQYITAGYNSLTFEPVMIAHKDRCDMVREEGMVLTIYEDSTIQLPPASLAPVAPDLDRFAKGLWPYDGSANIYVTQRNTQTVAAALDLVGLLAQKNRHPFDVRLSFSPDHAGHLLLVGDMTGVSDEIVKALPLQRRSWSAEGVQVGILQGVESERVVTAFTASDASALRAGIRQLNEQGLWHAMQGQAAVIDTGLRTASTEPAVNPVSFGSVKRLAASPYLHSWKTYIGGAAVLLLLLAFAVMHLLRNSKRNA